MENNDSNLTLEELQDEEKKLKKNELLAAGGIGFLAGIILYGLFTGGFGFLYTGISVGLIYMIIKNSRKSKERLKVIREELNKR
ncbi:hypothetical protein [Jiulongibacter sediminis]|uniref:Uncharacterized protein n=1 Tax=Jiulongibacter sediminis TaxID=1605367 RepID=A0A0P7BGK0_9BACT|nr:hypothetical protein [Jiulongibacter sediminis]KPM50167.1 hypothetical protein AFM12_05175 [Jiulongibacter sediminis]TBX27182.1 hypothetical protein TK44_05180 [Jiulongibacter sediminis]